MDIRSIMSEKTGAKEEKNIFVLTETGAQLVSDKITVEPAQRRAEGRAAGAGRARRRPPPPGSRTGRRRPRRRRRTCRLLPFTFFLFSMSNSALMLIVICITKQNFKTFLQIFC